MTLKGGVLRETTLPSWLLPDSNTIPKNCIRENAPKLRGYGIGFWCTRLLVRILPRLYISAMHLFICFFVTDFVRKKEVARKTMLKPFPHNDTF